MDDKLNQHAGEVADEFFSARELPPYQLPWPFVVTRWQYKIIISAYPEMADLFEPVDTGDDGV